MKIKVKMGYEHVLADVTGNELDTLVKVIAKSQKVDRQYLNGREFYVTPEDPATRPEFHIEIITNDDVKVISHAIAKTLADADRKKVRAKLATEIIELASRKDDDDNHEEFTKAVAKLTSQLYYDGLVNQTAKDAMVVVGDEFDKGIVQFTTDTSLYHVKTDGSFAFASVNAPATAK